MNTPVILPPPAIAQRLGYCALLPFLVGTFALGWPLDIASVFAANLLSAYAAVVLSFIGAIHWGLGMRLATPQSSLFVWGVVPSIVACAAQALPVTWGLLCHALMLAVCYGVDRQVYPQHGVQTWLPLRLHLTAVATLCCLVGAAAA